MPSNPTLEQLKARAKADFDREVERAKQTYESRIDVYPRFALPRSVLEAIRSTIDFAAWFTSGRAGRLADLLGFFAVFFFAMRAGYPVVKPLARRAAFSRYQYPFIAAEQTGRRCFGMEIIPPYCDVIVRRYEQFTGKKAEREHAA